MDMKLVAWARAVKARNGRAGRRGAGPPVLWLFTDSGRMGDPVAAVSRLPKGLCGVVFRHDGAAGRAGLAGAVARVCRVRRLAMVVAGDARLAAEVGAGVHLRGGRRGVVRVRGMVTASAHGRVELERARRAGAAVIFVSPVFATASHPGAEGMGAVRWSALARGEAALGGVDGRNVRRLGGCAAVGAIGALL